MDKFIGSFYIASLAVLVAGAGVTLFWLDPAVTGGFAAGFLCCFLPLPTFHAVVKLLSSGLARLFKALAITGVVAAQFAVIGLTFFLLISPESVNLLAVWAGASAIVAIIALGMALSGLSKPKKELS